MSMTVWKGFRTGRAARAAGPAALLAACLALSGPAGAEVVERVIATVDDEPILLSEVQARVQMELQALQVAETDTAAVVEIRRQVLESMIEQRLLAKEALEKGISVPEEEVAAAAEGAIERNRQELGSDARFREQLAQEGLTEESLRQRFMTEARREILAARLVQSELRDQITLTPEEVRQYYDAHRAELPPREEASHLQRIVWIVEPDSASLARSQALARQVAEQVRAGALGFAEAAKRYSDDPNGSDGGDLHRVRRGDLALGGDFETAAFSLPMQTVSDPLRSPLGLHLLWVQEKDPAGEWVHLSHILFRVPVLRADIERTRALAEAVRDRARAGEDFAELARRHSDAPEGPQGGDLGAVPLGAMDPDLQEAVQSLQPGGVSDVVELEGAFLVLRLVEREPARPFEFEEIEGELTDWVRARKMETLYEEWIVGVKERHHIERRAWE